MAEPARIYATEPDEIAEPKPVLQLVHDSVDRGWSRHRAERRTQRRDRLRGRVLRGRASSSRPQAPLAGWGFGNALGLGTFVGVWGGGGFGFMMGATIPYARYLDAQSTHSTHHGQGDTNDTAAR